MTIGWNTYAFYWNSVALPNFLNVVYLCIFIDILILPTHQLMKTVLSPWQELSDDHLHIHVLHWADSHDIMTSSFCPGQYILSYLILGNSVLSQI